ncbi:MAG: hypothetical protein U9M95_03890 [Candidatus Altiarchaeota archaeon]|nr:hypothetical protein [Candidatus Altiarchaeota archaeon]
MKKVFIVLIGLVLLTSNACAFYKDYITLDWRYLAKGGNVDMLVLDVDGDGSKEIVAGFYNDGFGYLINHTGAMVWNIQTIVGVEAVHAADLDNDGVPELLYGGGRTIYVSKIDGSLLFKYITQNNIRRISSGDLDGDGFVDIILASQSIRTSDLIVLDRDSKVIWQQTVGGTHPPDFSMADFNSDGNSEIIVAAGKSVKMFDSEGITLWNYKVDGEATDLEIADLDNDGVVDFVVSSTSSVYALDASGNLLWDFNPECVSEAVKVSDVDNDGTSEVVVGAFEKVYLLDNEGSVLWSRDSVRQTNDVTTGDLDLDGNLEIIAGSDVVDVFDVAGNKQWEYRPYMRVNQLRVSDLEGDGLNDLLVGALDNTLYLFKPRMIYVSREKSYVLCSEAEDLFKKGECDKALECINEALEIRDSFGVGECEENPTRCESLLEDITAEIKPSTTTSTSTTSTTTSSTLEASTSTHSTTTTIVSSGGDGDNILMFLVLGVLAVAAVTAYLIKARS